MNVLFKKRITCYLAMMVTIVFMTACSTTPIPPEDVPPALFGELKESSDFYLANDQRLGSDENLAWQFLAARALIKERKFVMADAVIASLQTAQLAPTQQAHLGLLIADNFYAQNKLAETQATLITLDTSSLNQNELIHYLKLQIAVHIRNELPLEASESLMILAPLLEIDTEKQANNELLFAQLLLLTDEQLNQDNIEKSAQPATDTLPKEQHEIGTDSATPVIENVAIDPTYKAGWYALASLYQKNKARANRLTRAFNAWKINYPEHEALPFLPLVLTDIAAFSPYQPDNIAVLLPLSGRFEKQAKAIQLGLLNAYYHQRNNTRETTDETLYAPKLHFFDTQSKNSSALASQLKLANIDFVVGPLLKKEIEQLLPLIEDMPVLALNRFAEKIEKPQENMTDVTTSEQQLETEVKIADVAASEQQLETEEKVEVEVEVEAQDNLIPWHYAFPLSPEDEAKQAAMMVFTNQHKTPLLIVPDSRYGKRVANAFREQWAMLTPESDIEVEAHYFQSKAKMATFIDDVLHTDKSKRRIDQMKAITKLKLETEVRSRRDVDAIYIVSKRDELILLKPFLDVSVSPFAQKIPLYASSRSHSSDRNNMQNKELSNLIFSDNPFLLKPESTLSKEVAQAWKKQSFSTLRLFALGYDSYQLIEQLVYLQSQDQAQYKGLIGGLTLDASNTIQAQLSWAKYYNGQLIEITSPITTE